MLELFVGLVDRLIKIVELRQTDRRQLFKEVAEPLFNQLQPVVGKTGKTEKLGGTIFPIFRVHHSCRRTALGPYLIDMLVMLPPTGQVKRDAAERGKVSEKKKEIWCTSRIFTLLPCSEGSGSQGGSAQGGSGGG